MEFTFDFYIKLIMYLKERYDFSSFSNYFPKKKLYLRHDVDVFPENIINLVEVEERAGVRSIFFFQPNCSFYNMLSSEIREIIRILEKSEFEVGLHIDATDLASRESIEREVKALFNFYSGYYNISNVFSFHRPPERLLQNLQIPGFVNTYEDRFFKMIHYFSDSNRRYFYDQMIESIQKDKEKSIQLVVHPYWWDYEHLDIQGLLTRLETMKTNETRFALTRGTKIYKQYFSRMNT